MSMMKKWMLLLALPLPFLLGCKIVKYAPDKLPVRQLVFGDGGGFAGIENSYTLLENGQLFRQKGPGGAYEELKGLKPKEAKAFFARLASLQLFKLDIDKPGNIYYFLQEINEKIDSRVTWGAGDYLPPQALIFLYKELYALVKDRPAIQTGKVKTEVKTEKKKEDDKYGW